MGGKTFRKTAKENKLPSRIHMHIHIRIYIYTYIEQRQRITALSLLAAARAAATIPEPMNSTPEISKDHTPHRHVPPLSYPPVTLRAH